MLREVLTIAGPTPEYGISGPAVMEWCIDTAAVDPLTKSMLANIEDSWLHRWSMVSNSFTQRIRRTSDIAQRHCRVVHAHGHRC